MKNKICSTIAEYFFENIFYSFYNNSILLYCANFYGRGFIRVYEDKMPIIKVCTVQQNTIIIIIHFNNMESSVGSSIRSNLGSSVGSSIGNSIECSTGNSI